MEQEEKTQKKNEEKNSQRGCCDFTSEETQGMFKMMREFRDGSEKDSFDCRSMMKGMMKNMSSKSDDCGCAVTKNNVQNKSKKPDAIVEHGSC